MTMVMTEMSYTATRLKAELLGVLDRVHSSGEPVIVTKHGRPVARIVPIDETAPLEGSVRFLVGENELLRPVDAVWDAEVS